MKRPAFDPWYRWRCRTCKAPITRLASAPPTGTCPGCSDIDNFVLVEGPPAEPRKHENTKG